MNPADDQERRQAEIRRESAELRREDADQRRDAAEKLPRSLSSSESKRTWSAPTPRMIGALPSGCAPLRSRSGRNSSSYAAQRRRPAPSRNRRGALRRVRGSTLHNHVNPPPIRRTRLNKLECRQQVQRSPLVEQSRSLLFPSPGSRSQTSTVCRMAMTSDSPCADRGTWCCR